MSSARFVPVIINLVSATLLGVLLFHYSTIGHAIANWWTDFKTVGFSDQSKTPEDIVLVTITEDTLSTLPYRSPIDRHFLAQTITQLLEKGAKTVALDILIDQPTEDTKDKALFQVFQFYKDRINVVYADKTDGLSASQMAYQEAFLKDVGKMKPNLGKDINDGVVRWIYQRQESDTYPPFVEQLLHRTGVPLPEPSPKTRLIYPLSAPEKPLEIATYEAHKVSFLPASWFKDKYVLIGVDLATSDRHRTPFASVLGEGRGNLAGVYIHALALHQLLNGDTWVETPPIGVMGLAFCGALIGIMLVRLPLRTPFKVLSGLGAIALYLALDIALFKHLQLIHPPIAIIFSAIFAFSLSSTRHHFKERSKRTYLQHAFQHYLSKEVVDQLVAHPDNLKLGGERKRLTFLFADLADFTRLSESCTPEQLVGIINDYNELISSEILRHKGTIDKFSGDGINAFFGAPTNDPDHQQNALNCALSLRRITAEFSKRYQQKGYQVGKTRIGVHTGEAIVGNFGGTERFQYTALGGAVNTAARLESLNKYCGTLLLSTPETVDATDIAARPVGRFILKGQNTPLDVIEPLFPDDPYLNFAEIYPLFEHNPVKALAQLQPYCDKHPDDHVAQFHLKRLKTDETDFIIKMSEK